MEIFLNIQCKKKKKKETQILFQSSEKQKEGSQK